MYEANYVYMMANQRELSQHSTAIDTSVSIYSKTPGLRAKVYARLGTLLISLGKKLREASQIQEQNVLVELSQECS